MKCEVAVQRDVLIFIASRLHWNIYQFTVFIIGRCESDGEGNERLLCGCTQTFSCEIGKMNSSYHSM